MPAVEERVIRVPERRRRMAGMRRRVRVRGAKKLVSKRERVSASLGVC